MIRQVGEQAYSEHGGRTRRDIVHLVLESCTATAGGTSPAAPSATPDPAGTSAYDVHVVSRAKHGQPKRYRMRCLRVPKHIDPPTEVRVIWLTWYPRGRR